MYPILYEAGETTFQSNGIGVLVDAIKCEVIEERNGVYELELEYPVTGRHYDDILEGRIIGSIHDDKKDVQPFTIYSRSADMGGTVVFYAHHISYATGLIAVKPFSASSVAQAMQSIPGNVLNTCPFTFWTDKTTTANFEMAVPKALKDLLGGSQGSLLDVFGGGEYEWDKFQVKLYQNRGEDTDVRILYGKNLMTLKQSLDISGCYDAVVPYWYSEETEDGSAELVVANGYVVTPTGKNDTARVAILDLSAEFETAPTVQQLTTKAIQTLDAQKPWVPPENIELSFTALWQTEDYKLIAPLERVSLCDTVIVSYPELGVDNVRAKVVKVTYDVLLERYSSMELGEAKTSFADTIKASVGKDIKKTVATNRSFMADAIARATALITGGTGGHVVINTNADGQPNEILIMDTPNKATAVNVWRFNLNGLGHSHSGYGGPFSDVALTMDGQINANMITTGSINANMIKSGAINANLITTGEINANLITTGYLSANRLRAGTISDAQSDNYWNLSTGNIVTTKGKIGALSIGTSGLYVSDSTPISATKRTDKSTQIYPDRIYMAEDQVTVISDDLEQVDGDSLTITHAGIVMDWTVSDSLSSRVQVTNKRISIDDFGLYKGFTVDPPVYGIRDFDRSRWVLRYVIEEDGPIITGDAEDHVSIPLPFTTRGWDGTTERKSVQSISTDGKRVGYMTANDDGLAVRGQWGGDPGASFSSHTFSWGGSDIRIKTEIQESQVNALALIEKIRIMEFRKSGRYQPIGMIADWIEELDPLLAIGGGYDDDGAMNVKSVDTFYLQGYEVKAIQELSAKVDELTEKVAKLEAMIEKLTS